MPSPICEVKYDSEAYVPTTNGVDVPAESTVTIRLVDTSASSWSISCIYADELTDPEAINESLTIDIVQRTATFTAPADNGRTLIFRSVVNNGKGPDGRNVPSYTTTFGIYIPTADNYRVIAANERLEGHSKAGWVASINKFIRNPIQEAIPGSAGYILTSDGDGGFGTPIAPPSGTNGQILTSDGSGGFGTPINSAVNTPGSNGDILTSDGANGFGSTITPPSGDLVGTIETQTLSNKSLVSPTVEGAPSYSIEENKAYILSTVQSVTTEDTTETLLFTVSSVEDHSIIGVTLYATMATEDCSKVGVFTRSFAVVQVAGSYRLLGDVDGADLDKKNNEDDDIIVDEDEVEPGVFAVKVFVKAADSTKRYWDTEIRLQYRDFIVE